MIYHHRDVGYNRIDGKVKESLSFTCETELLSYLERECKRGDENFYIEEDYVLMGKPDIKLVIGRINYEAK